MHSRAPPARAHTPLKLKKIWFFGVKSWFSTRNTPTIFAPPSVRRNFLSAPPNLKSWIRPCILFTSFVESVIIYTFHFCLNVRHCIIIVTFEYRSCSSVYIWWLEYNALNREEINFINKESNPLRKWWHFVKSKLVCT